MRSMRVQSLVRVPLLWVHLLFGDFAFDFSILVRTYHGYIKIKSFQYIQTCFLTRFPQVSWAAGLNTYPYPYPFRERSSITIGCYVLFLRTRCFAPAGPRPR